jgi:Poly(hydroxyalcanoate) granule associated protein (phasin)
MAMKKTRTKAQRKVTRTVTPSAGARIQEAWADTAAAVTRAQANLEAEVRHLLKRSKAGTRDAATLFQDLRSLADRERRKAIRELRPRLLALKARLAKEQRTAKHSLDEGIASTLAALNIPSRAEIAALTRKVEGLSRKMEALAGPSLWESAGGQGHGREAGWRSCARVAA